MIESTSAVPFIISIVSLVTAIISMAIAQTSEDEIKKLKKKLKDIEHESRCATLRSLSEECFRLRATLISRGQDERCLLLWRLEEILKNLYHRG